VTTLTNEASTRTTADVTTSTTTGGLCEKEYDEWYGCVKEEMCKSTCSEKHDIDGFLLPGEACNAFSGWYSDNFKCCVVSDAYKCNRKLEELKKCKECSETTTTQEPFTTTTETATETMTTGAITTSHD